MAPALAGEHPLTVLALVGLPAAPAAQALEQRGPHRATRVLLVAPQVQLGLEELVAQLAAERGLLWKREGCAVGGARGAYPAPAPSCPVIPAQDVKTSGTRVRVQGARGSTGPLLRAGAAVGLRRPRSGAEKAARPSALFMNQEKKDDRAVMRVINYCRRGQTN